MDNSLVLGSLRRRLVALHSLYRDASSTMTLDHVNAVVQSGALPIAFSWFHIINMMDASLMLLTGELPLWNDDWSARVNPSIADHGKHKTPEEMAGQRIGDLGAMVDYQEAVFDRTLAWIDGLSEGDLHRVIFARPFPDQIASTFSARVADDVGITVLDGVECWIYQHGMRHMGEIEYVRGLLGLGGMT